MNDDDVTFAGGDRCLLVAGEDIALHVVLDIAKLTAERRRYVNGNLVLKRKLDFGVRKQASTSGIG